MSKSTTIKPNHANITTQLLLICPAELDEVGLGVVLELDPGSTGVLTDSDVDCPADEVVVGTYVDAIDEVLAFRCSLLVNNT